VRITCRSGAFVPRQRLRVDEESQASRGREELFALGLEARGALERRCGQLPPVKTGGLSLKEEA